MFDTVYPQISQSVRLKQRSLKEKYDRTRKLLSFEIGDIVMFEKPPVQKHGKLDSIYNGPAKIIRIRTPVNNQDIHSYEVVFLDGTPVSRRPRFFAPQQLKLVANPEAIVREINNGEFEILYDNGITIHLQQVYIPVQLLDNFRNNRDVDAVENIEEEIQILLEETLEGRDM